MMLTSVVINGTKHFQTKRDVFIYILFKKSSMKNYAIISKPVTKAVSSKQEDENIRIDIYKIDSNQNIHI